MSKKPAQSKMHCSVTSIISVKRHRLENSSTFPVLLGFDHFVFSIKLCPWSQLSVEIAWFSYQTVLQGSGNKQKDSDTAWSADHSSFINTTTLTANPGEDAAILPPLHHPQVPSNIRWEASSYSSQGSICNKRHPFSRPAAERLGTSHSSPSH